MITARSKMLPGNSAVLYQMGTPEKNVIHIEYHNGQPLVKGDDTFVIYIGEELYKIPFDMDNGEWHTIALSRDVTEVILYIDGVAMGAYRHQRISDKTNFITF